MHGVLAAEAVIEAVERCSLRCLGRAAASIPVGRESGQSGPKLKAMKLPAFALPKARLASTLAVPNELYCVLKLPVGFVC